MKQVSRIFLIMMALVLMVGSAFAAVPGNRAQLDNLPDTPEVPSMTVAKDYSAKNTYHIALSDALESISPVINWKWLPIDMSADGLTGTFTTDGYVAAPGAGTWTSHWTGSWPADYVAAEDCPTVWFYKTMDDNWIEDGTYAATCS